MMKMTDFNNVEHCLILIDDKIEEVRVNQIADVALKLYFPLNVSDRKTEWFDDHEIVTWELLEVLRYCDDDLDRKRAETT